MPWYLSFSRITQTCLYSWAAFVQANWIRHAEDTYRRSLTWSAAVGTIYEHKIVFNKMGASHVWYRFTVNGKEYTGDQFRSGGIYKEEHLKNATLLGVGTELVIYYNPGDPTESAIKIAQDRSIEAFFVLNTLFCLAIAYRCVRCETLLPTSFYRFLNVNRRLAEGTGMRIQSNKRKRPGRSYPNPKTGKWDGK